LKFEVFLKEKSVGDHKTLREGEDQKKKCGNQGMAKSDLVCCSASPSVYASCVSDTFGLYPSSSSVPQWDIWWGVVLPFREFFTVDGF